MQVRHRELHIIGSPVMWVEVTNVGRLSYHDRFCVFEGLVITSLILTFHIQHAVILIENA